MFDILDDMETAELVQPYYSLGSSFLETVIGKYLPGDHGSSILNAGLSHVNSIAGPPNAFKTAVLTTQILNVTARYGGSSIIYDNEGSMQWSRIKELSTNIPFYDNIGFTSVEDTKYVRIVPGTHIFADDFFEKVKKLSTQRSEAKKKPTKAFIAEYMGTTPFDGLDGKPIRVIRPFIVAFDSFSGLTFSNIQEKIADKGVVGGSDQNVIYLKENNAKTQILKQIVYQAERGDIQFYLSSHIGKKVSLSEYETKDTKLAGNKDDMVYKGVTKKFEYINNNLFDIKNAALFFNSSQDKTARYPKDETDRNEGAVDLMYIDFKNTRNKNGASNLAFKLIISQSEGVLDNETNFVNIKEVFKNYGITGSNVSYTVDLYPSVNLSRTTVRKKMAEDPLLAKAIEFQACMAWMMTHWKLESKYRCTPAQLRKDLEDMGYDWNILLDTRHWWCFVEDEHKNKPLLTTMDLLKMRAGEYKPYWMK